MAGTTAAVVGESPLGTNPRSKSASLRDGRTAQWDLRLGSAERPIHSPPKPALEILKRRHVVAESRWVPRMPAQRRVAQTTPVRAVLANSPCKGARPHDHRHLAAGVLAEADGSWLDVRRSLHSLREGSVIRETPGRRCDQGFCAPGRTRTCDLEIRRLLLYPAELRGPVLPTAGGHPQAPSLVGTNQLIV